MGGLIGVGVDCITNCIAKPAQHNFYIDERWFQVDGKGQPVKKDDNAPRRQGDKNVYSNIDDMFK